MLYAQYNGLGFSFSSLIKDVEKVAPLALGPAGAAYVAYEHFKPHEKHPHAHPHPHAMPRYEVTARQAPAGLGISFWKKLERGAAGLVHEAEKVAKEAAPIASLLPIPGAGIISTAAQLLPQAEGIAKQAAGVVRDVRHLVPAARAAVRAVAPAGLTIVPVAAAPAPAAVVPAAAAVVPAAAPAAVVPAVAPTPYEGMYQQWDAWRQANPQQWEAWRMANPQRYQQWDAWRRARWQRQQMQQSQFVNPAIAAGATPSQFINPALTTGGLGIGPHHGFEHRFAHGGPRHAFARAGARHSVYAPKHGVPPGPPSPRGYWPGGPSFGPGPGNGGGGGGGGGPQSPCPPPDPTTGQCVPCTIDPTTGQCLPCILDPSSNQCVPCDPDQCPPCVQDPTSGQCVPQPGAAPAGGGPPGGLGECTTRFNTTRNMWSVYCPGGTPGGLGDSVTPAAPTGMTKVGESPTPVLGTWDLGDEADKKPLYKKWQFWAATVGGVALVGTTGYLFVRRRRYARAY